MSADLFAEFGYGAPPSQTPGSRDKSTFRSQQSSLIPDLEPIENTPIDPASQAFHPQTASVRSTFFSEHNPSHSRPYNNGNDVLFDATLETLSDHESDDWGEFESADTAPNQPLPTEPAHHQKPIIDHVDINTTGFPVSANHLESLDSLSIHDPAPVPNKPKITHCGDNVRAINKPFVPSTSAKPIAPDDPFEEWGDFIDGPPSDIPTVAKPQKPPSKKTGPIQATSKTKSSKTGSRSSASFVVGGNAVPTTDVRPTNIPPPSVLLELFPQIFEQLRQDATNARKNMQEIDNLEHVAFLITCSLKAAARVVAGRTLRWKRDTILSQSMKIGPARSGKSGGMKLNTVNKNEDIKEQQEAIDVITIWRDRAALFNSVIQASGRRPVHIVSESTRAVTATQAQGAIKANHACALCGLKRDERLARFDEAVEDSFGEWWTDHWGHTDCRQFWESNANLLRQR
ncbi:hypothetical protein FE257_012635 [Aspergillus nanangensis]|uniref:Uncharacterized protein n=1 Tax=Aspergillus nanangensis TaxID=2582783 RepID=A0AAD4CFZ3_ASPNN|nr:hypothetical protein FE257_012635 [Aspergillus nanangensis]